MFPSLLRRRDHQFAANLLDPIARTSAVAREERSRLFWSLMLLVALVLLALPHFTGSDYWRDLIVPTMLAAT